MNTSTKHEYLKNLDLRDAEVLDLGCGDASYWVHILASNPSMKLHLFEPDKKVLDKAKGTLEGGSVTFTSDLNSLANKEFDVITCFAVLEHVFNLNDFVKNLSLLLAKNGVAYINYDDGHFRNHLYQNKSTAFRMRNKVKTHLSFLWRILKWYSKYQKPVSASELSKYIEQNNLVVLSESYHSLDSIEVISGILDEKTRIKIFPLLVEIEVILNSNIEKDTKPTLRGHSSLFMCFNSRTLVLGHKGAHSVIN